MKHRSDLHDTVGIAVLVGAISLFSGIGGAAEQRDRPVTFTRDVAPILFQHCAGCHQPEGNAPFDLLSYKDVRPRARQIAVAVASGYMPPWKPEHGFGDFVGERRLSAAETETIDRWVREGAYEGALADLPSPPQRTAGWQLGRPDIVLDLPDYTLAPGGKDEFRNFAIAVPGADTRFVRGMEFRANNRAVHHANVFVDPTAASRRLDEADPLPGYRGLIPRSAAFPDGHFLGWTPGQIAPLEPKGHAWRLEPGSDLLVQLHLMQSDRAERIHPSIGLFFTSEPPTETPAMLRLGKQNIDIAPGDASYLVADSYVLPVDVDVQAVQPHAHYRAREIKAWALLPDGSRRWLIYIRRWDFNWQDQYRYVTPLSLPAGTRLMLEYIFDNSTANRHNPDAPPQHVRWGQRSGDEMGDLWIQMVTHSERDLVALSRQVRRKMIAEDVVGYETEISADPRSAVLHNDAAVLYLEIGQPERAVAHFAEVRRLQPGGAAAPFNLATALEKAGRDDEAIEQYREAVRLDPAYVRARKGLANALLVAGRVDDAIVEYGRLLPLDADDAESRNNLAFAKIQNGDLEGAVAALQQALKLKPDYVEAHYNLGRAFSLAGRPAAARLELGEALRLRRDWVPALTELAWLQATTSDPEVRNAAAAVALALRSVDLSRHADAAALNALAAAYAASGRFDDACRTAETAVDIAAVSAPLLVAAIRANLNLFRAGQPVRIVAR